MNLFAPAAPYSYQGHIGTLAEHLGYSESDRLVIINADDLGINPEVNDAVIELITKGAVCSTSIMVPGTAYQDALDKLFASGTASCGVHLTLTSTFPLKPLSAPGDPQAATSLVSDGSHFHSGREEFFKTARPEEAMIEATAQIERAISDGLDITHLDSHEGTLQLRHEFAEVYCRLALHYRLPLRMASVSLIRELGLSADLLDQARSLGLHFPDNLVYLPIRHFSSAPEKEALLLELVERLPAGVTEFYFHPAPASRSETAESDSNARLVDYEILTSGGFLEALRKRDVILTDFRPLRELIRTS